MTKRIFALIVALLMVATLFAACGDDAKAEKDDDKKTTTVAATAAPTEAPTAAPTAAPTEAPTETLGAIPTDDSIVGTWTVEEDDVTLTYSFNADGTGSATATTSDSEEPALIEFIWEVNGNSLSMTADGEVEEGEFKIENGELVLMQDGIETLRLTLVQ